MTAPPGRTEERMGHPAGEAGCCCGMEGLLGRKNNRCPSWGLRRGRAAGPGIRPQSWRPSLPHGDAPAPAQDSFLPFSRRTLAFPILSLACCSIDSYVTCNTALPASGQALGVRGGCRVHVSNIFKFFLRSLWSHMCQKRSLREATRPLCPVSPSTNIL